MFFIVNHENSIIAADADFLEGIGANDIYEAALLIKKGEVVLDELEQSISYFQKNSAFSKTALSTFLGDAYLYEINEEDDQTTEEPQDDTPFSLAMPQENLPDETIEEKKVDKNDTEKEKMSLEAESKDEEVFGLVDEREEPATGEEPLAFSEPAETAENLLGALSSDIHSLGLVEESKEIHIAEGDSDMISDEIIGLVETDTEIAEAVEKPELLDAEQNIDLMISDEAVIAIHEPDEAEATVSVTEETKEHTDTFSETTETATEKNHTNFQEISELVGVSEEEYLHFLDDFRKESSLLETNLRSNDLRESREAISILKEASLLLHLPQITEKLNELSNATSNEKSSVINSYLEMVTEITSTKEYAAPAPDITADVKPADSSTVEEKMPLENEAPEILESSAEEKIEPIPPKSIEPPANQVSVSLDHIQAVPFDFSINEAADELTLPASLVSEFVIDFISQAKENLPVLEKAYEEKDLDNIQSTAHMLKGASSNLRIVPMAETLYQLQFNKDLARVPELITLFKGQLKALSLQMDQI